MNTTSPLEAQLAREHRERRARYAAQAVQEPPPRVEPPPPPPPVWAPPPPPPPVVSGEDVLKLEELRAHREALSRMSLPMRRVAKAVCDEFHVRADELIGESRKLRLVRPRQVAIHLLMWRSDPSNPWSLNRIGRVFRRDHTTVLNDDRRIRALVVEDAELAATVARLKEGLQ